jgi:hypothetical protein
MSVSDLKCDRCGEVSADLDCAGVCPSCVEYWQRLAAVRKEQSREEDHSLDRATDREDMDIGEWRGSAVCPSEASRSNVCRGKGLSVDVRSSDSSFG